MEAMQEANQRIREDTELWRCKYESLKKFAMTNKIAIPPELEHP